jgi:hypothetical protein
MCRDLGRGSGCLADCHLLRANRLSSIQGLKTPPNRIVLLVALRLVRIVLTIVKDYETRGADVNSPKLCRLNVVLLKFSALVM